jgi:hypothetical protein
MQRHDFDIMKRNPLDETGADYFDNGLLGSPATGKTYGRIPMTVGIGNLCGREAAIQK